jgi:hypothetical protein
MASYARTIDEELAFRAGRQEVFGGSDAPDVFGYGYRNALDVYHAKTRELRREDVIVELEDQPIDFFRGHRNEPDAIRLFLEMKGYEGRHETRQIFAPGSDVVAVHIDGTVFADPARPAPRDQTGIIEAKSPRAQGFAKLITEGVHVRYSVQTQFNCAVTGRPWGAMAFFCDHHDAGPVLPLEVDADPELGRMMLERAEEFMLHHVAARIPPDPNEWSLVDVEGVTERLVGRSGEYVVVDDPAFVDDIAMPLIRAQRLQKEAREHYNELRAEAKEHIEDHYDSDAILLPSGDKLRIIRKEGLAYLDQDRLRDHQPLDRDAFVRWLREQRNAALVEWTDEEMERIASDLTLDFTRFEKQGRDSAYVQPYAAK